MAGHEEERKRQQLLRIRGDHDLIRIHGNRRVLQDGVEDVARDLRVVVPIAGVVAQPREDELVRRGPARARLPAKRHKSGRQEAEERSPVGQVIHSCGLPTSNFYLTSGFSLLSYFQLLPSNFCLALPAQSRETPRLDVDDEDDALLARVPGVSNGTDAAGNVNERDVVVVG